MKSGVLVAFEGIDGAGKSTQIAAVAAEFGARGWEVVTTREPTDGPHGRALRASARTGRLPVHEELELFERDRRDHVHTVISPGLERGALVLVDRYYFSTAAYQGIRGLDPADIVARNEAFAPRPHLLVVLTLPAHVGLARVQSRGGADEFERLADLQRCAEIFAAFQGDWVVHVDATQPVPAITREIVARLSATVDETHHEA